MNDPIEDDMLKLAKAIKDVVSAGRIVVKEYVATNNAGSPTPNFFMSCALLEQSIDALDKLNI